jgi:hypothetical protein
MKTNAIISSNHRCGREAECHNLTKRVSRGFLENDHIFTYRTAEHHDIVRHYRFYHNSPHICADKHRDGNDDNARNPHRINPSLFGGRRQVAGYQIVPKIHNAFEVTAQRAYVYRTLERTDFGEVLRSEEVEVFINICKGAETETQAQGQVFDTVTTRYCGGLNDVVTTWLQKRCRSLRRFCF